MSKPKEVQEFEGLARPLMKWLNENHHPHSQIVITPIKAKLLYNQMSTGNIWDYVPD